MPPHRAAKKAGIDGVFGDSTREAVLDFQKKCHLKQTGNVDKNTWDALDMAVLDADVTNVLEQWMEDYKSWVDYVRELRQNRKAEQERKREFRGKFKVIINR